MLAVTVRQTSGWKLASTRWVAEAGGAATPAGAIAKAVAAACVGIAAMPSSCAEEAVRSPATESESGATSGPAKSTTRSAAASRPKTPRTKPWNRIPPTESTLALAELAPLRRLACPPRPVHTIRVVFV